MENFGKFMAVILLLILAPIANGYVFATLWGWFIVTTFHVAPLTIIQSIGIMFTYGFITHKYNSTTTEKNENAWKKFAEAVLTLVLSIPVILGMGWILTLFM